MAKHPQWNSTHKGIYRCDRCGEAISTVYITGYEGSWADEEEKRKKGLDPAKPWARSLPYATAQAKEKIAGTMEGTYESPRERVPPSEALSRIASRLTDAILARDYEIGHKSVSEGAVSITALKVPIMANGITRMEDINFDIFERGDRFKAVVSSSFDHGWLQTEDFDPQDPGQLIDMAIQKAQKILLNLISAPTAPRKTIDEMKWPKGYADYKSKRWCRICKKEIGMVSNRDWHTSDQICDSCHAIMRKPQ